MHHRYLPSVMSTRLLSLYILWLCLKSWTFADPYIMRRKRDVYNKTTVLVTPNCSVPICPGSVGKIYCTGAIMSQTWYFGTQKQCPGPSMRFPADTVIENFAKLPADMSKERFLDFCAKNFINDSYLDPAPLPDWTPNPPNLNKIKDLKLREFGSKLNDLWKVLGRKFKQKVFTNPELFPVYLVNNSFVVPGGFFQTYFYWDTFWISKGLLFSGMDDTVLGILRNFAQIIEQLGYLPNAGTIPLASRTQPPVFAQMVWDYIEKAEKFKIFSSDHAKSAVLKTLEQLVPALDKEFQFYMDNRSVEVKGSNGDTFTMFHYKTETNCPRPESFADDIENAKISGRNHEDVWRSITSACESGWDFSTRWFSYSGNNKDKMSSIRTPDIIPVDLNGFLCKNAQILTDFYEKLDNKEKADYYRNIYKSLVKAVDQVFWNESAGIWFDYDNRNLKHRDKFYTSNLFPLYAQCYKEKDGKFAKIADYLKKEGVLEYKGGIPISLGLEGQQWDFPNGWPPAVHLFIESLRLTKDSQLMKIAFKTAQKWINTNYRGFMSPSHGREAGMWEKYDVRFDDGSPGTGGEYPVQQGFGWTNGVVLDLLYLYGDRLTSPDHPHSSSSSRNNSHKVVIISCLLVALFVFGFSVGHCLSKKCRDNQSIRRQGRDFLPLFSDDSENEN